MDAETVFFTPWESFTNTLALTRKLYEAAELFSVVEKGDLVAVKLHVGELGNPNYVRPYLVKQVLDLVEKRGGKPFLTDSSTLYLARRANALDHMKTAVANGFGFAPFISADGLNGENVVPVPSPDPGLEPVEVAGAIYEADAMIVVSHFKGHPLAGFGGAIKNLGMGGVSKRTKFAQHRKMDLELALDLCQGCGECVEACRFGLPYLEEEKAVIDHPECMRCISCLSACPEKAIRLVNKERLGPALAVAAAGVLSTFKKGKVAFINFATDITTYCDCVPFSTPSFEPDLGVLAGFSPLSLDAAGLARINYQHLNEIHQTDCWAQVNELVRLGVPGSREPKVVEV